MLTSGPFTLVTGTPQRIDDPSAANSNPSASVQVQNGTAFVIFVQSNGESYTIQPFTAQTVPTADGGQSIIINPQASTLTSPVNTLYVVWLLAGESPPMSDGPLTAAALEAAISGIAQVEVTNSVLPISGAVDITSGTVDATITGGNVNIAAGTVDIGNAGGVQQLNVGPVEEVITSGTIPAVTFQITLTLPGWCNSIAVGVAPAAGNTNPALVEVTGNVSRFTTRGVVTTAPVPQRGNVLTSAGQWRNGGVTGPISVFSGIDNTVVIFFNQATAGTTYWIIGSNEYYNQIVSGAMGVYGIAGNPVETYPIGGISTFTAVQTTTTKFTALSAPSAVLAYRLHNMTFGNTGAANSLSLEGTTSTTVYGIAVDPVGALGGMCNLDGQIVTEGLSYNSSMAALYRISLTYDIIEIPVPV